MQELAFQELPQQHRTLIDSIKNSTIQKIYSQFNFLFYHIPNLINKKDFVEKDYLYQDPFVNFLKNFKFICYHIQDINPILYQDSMPEYKEKSDTNLHFFDLIFCTEGKCFIIHQIQIIIIKKIITELKKYQISMINVGIKYNEDDKSLQEEINEEIKNFCFHFQKEIMKNEFVKYTISSISGYLIRRFFYPTEYFEDASFFSFDQMIIKEQTIKKKLKKIIFSNLDEIDESTNKNFKEEEEEEKFEEINNQYLNQEEELENFNENENEEEEKQNENKEEEEEKFEENFVDTNLEEELKNFNENEEEEEEQNENEEEEEFSESDDDDDDIKAWKYRYKNNTKNNENMDEKEIFDRSFIDDNNLKPINNEIFNTFYCNNNNDINVKIFQNEDFIILRTVYGNKFASFNLVIHIESLYVFMMKKFINTIEFSKEIIHEIEFCENFSHRCFTRFYGFIKKDKNITGIIYEYMCNGDLYSYFNSNYEHINEIYKITVINRIFQGIKFLHQNSLIHRDLKPSNILLDHDYIPYISDFETICQPSEKTMTADIGSFFYVSPEQNKNKSYSYPTDIYSFGQIIFFIYETNNLKNQSLLKMQNGSRTIQELYELCVQNSPSERPTYEKIISILIKEVNSYYYFEEYFCNEKVKTQEFEIIQFFYEKMVLLQLYKSLNKCCDQIYKFDYLYRERKGNIKCFYFTIGYYYQIGKYVDKNISKALKYYELSAKEGYILALNNLGLLYKNGIGIKQDFNKAKECFEKQIQLSENMPYYYSRALFNLGLLYDKCICDYKKAIYYYKLSANDFAYLNIGNLYFYGHGVKQNFLKAKKYYEMSNLGEANYNIGILYLNGFGVEQNVLKAIKIFNKGYNTAFAPIIGDIYFYGYYIKRDFQKAKKIYKNTLFDPQSLINLGEIYFNGYCKKNNYKKAIKCYELLIEIDNSEGYLKLGNMYENGYGVKQDLIKAKELYEKSINLNNIDAFNKLGDLYFKENNYLMAKKYYEFAARQNNAEAIFKLGDIYYNGYGIEKDYQKAEKLYEFLSSLNDSDIFIELGDLYSNGKSAKQDYSKAKKFYELAAKQNNSDAFFKLALLYYHGRGVEQDYSKAKEYYDLIFSEDSSNYYLEMGDIYENGHGVVVDELLAINYYEKAARYNSKAYIKLGDFYYEKKKMNLIAKDYYQLAAQNNNSDAFLKLGNLFEKELNYSKAKYYYEKSALTNNSESIFKLGYLYYYGFGVKQNYFEARFYFKYAVDYFNNPNALFYLGCLYSNENFCEFNRDKAIKYLERCYSIKNEKIEINKRINKKYSKLNKYRYRSKNDAGLIYLLYDNNFNKAEDCLKISAFSEYPFAQNNFGLFCLFKLKNEENAKYMFNKAKRSYFAISQYNLGYLQEEKGKIEDAIINYRQASENEDKPLTFHNFIHIDKRFEISKTFILCYTNLKLVDYYLSKLKFDEAKRFFLKSLQKLISNNKFEFHLNESDKDIENLLSYLKSFILKFPLFNLINQPNLSNDQIQYLNKLPEFNQIQKMKIESSAKNDCAQNQNLENKDNFKFLNNLMKPLKIVFDIFKEIKNNSNKKIKYFDPNDSVDIKTNDEKKLHDPPNKIKILNDPDSIFDFLIKNDEIKKIFVDFIKEIVHFMKTVLYSPPYYILYGRICILNPKKTENNNLLLKDIDDSFYEGFCH